MDGRIQTRLMFPNRVQTLPQVASTLELKSGREDLNLRPHGPEPCALAKLSYAPSAFPTSLMLQSSGGVSTGLARGDTVKACLKGVHELAPFRFQIGLAQSI